MRGYIHSFEATTHANTAKFGFGLNMVGYVS